ncbi:MAG: four helix bundle protein [Deltaproteobacteria bacterium]|nr:four helix bundle protein [Deltaproteobacteria bacterium]
MGYSLFENLDVWKRASRLAVRTYEVLKDCRDFSLKDQMCRSAVSIASNIAKGDQRESKKEFVRFLHIAKGSAAELRTQVYIASKIGVVSPEIQKEMVEELMALSKMLHQLSKSIANRNS